MFERYRVKVFQQGKRDKLIIDTLSSLHFIMKVLYCIFIVIWTDEAAIKVV